MGTEVANSRLTKLRTEIITQHESFITSMKESMQSAIKAGEFLLSAKENIEYGKFQEWIETNLPFSLRTAQNYMKVAKKQDVIEEKGARMLSAAYDAVKDKKPKKNYRDEHEKYEEVIDDEDFINKESTKQEREHDEKILHPEDFEKPEVDLSYLPVILKASNSLRWAYRQLASTRNSTTPKALGFLIGNLIEMAERVETWKPENMHDCPDCNGTGVMATYNSLAAIEHTVCPNCINGKTGDYKITKR